MKVFVWGNFGPYPEASGGTIVVADSMDEARNMLRQSTQELYNDVWANFGWASLNEAVEARLAQYQDEPTEMYETPIVLEVCGFVCREKL